MAKMRLSSYTFTVKDGKRYTCSQANNRYEARKRIESVWNVDLKGAAYEEHYGARILAKGIER